MKRYLYSAVAVRSTVRSTVCSVVCWVVCLTVWFTLSTAKAQDTVASPTYQELVDQYFKYFEAERPDSAEMALRKALNLYPDNESNFMLRGNLSELLVARGDTIAALSELSAAITDQPTMTPLRSRRAQLYEELGQYNAALIDLDEIIKLQPTWEIPIYKRAGVRSKLGLHNGAIDDLERILRLNPEAYLPRVALARELETTGDVMTAEKLLTRLTEEYPKIPNGYRALGWLLLRQDRKADALDRARHLILEMKDRNKENYLLRGAVWYRYGEVKEAEKDWAEAERLGATPEEIEKAKRYEEL
ncbi:MAG: tetratricopeptide repeat protein [Porphyromonas sp.]|nr:tetratricopeptide repeat protein [Porphyromonas sp.]